MFALYLRLFSPKVWLRYACYIGLITTFLSYWVAIPLTGIYCAPRNRGPWDFQVFKRCTATLVMSPVHGAVGLAADIFILVLPLPIVYQLNMALPKKIGLCVVFLMGFLYVDQLDI